MLSILDLESAILIRLLVAFYSAMCKGLRKFLQFKVNYTGVRAKFVSLKIGREKPTGVLVFVIAAQFTAAISSWSNGPIFLAQQAYLYTPKEKGAFGIGYLKIVDW